MYQVMAAKKGYVLAADSYILAHTKMTNGYLKIYEFACFFLPKEEALEITFTVVLQSAGFVRKTTRRIWQGIVEGGFNQFWKNLVGRGKILDNFQAF